MHTQIIMGLAYNGAMASDKKNHAALLAIISTSDPGLTYLDLNLNLELYALVSCVLV